jgi:FO synthase
MKPLDPILEAAARGGRMPADDALRLVDAPAPALLAVAEALTLQGFGRVVTYSRKVFIPLTQLCRDVCHYCTFAKVPRNLASPYLSIGEAVAIARAGAAAGCKEALFTLGDQPELRYAAARTALAEMGFATTIDYLAEVARQVHEATGLLPHLNPGILSLADIRRLREVSVSMGIMLETASERLSQKGGPHYGSPDKDPERRLATLRAGGEARVPFTTGLLIGIGETRLERIEALLRLRDLNDGSGHLQELIIQNFKPKPGTRMAHAPEPSLDEHLWSIAAARLIFGASMSIQAPPNLQGDLKALTRAGVNDWGGVSPVTPDHVNPEAPWPHLDVLRMKTEQADRILAERLAIVPRFAQDAGQWTAKSIARAVVDKVDSEGLVRSDPWVAGAAMPAPSNAIGILTSASKPSSEVSQAIARACDGATLSEGEIVTLFAAREADFAAVVTAADRLRAAVSGDTVSYVVNRNINYTNICGYKCGFCAFSKGGGSRDARGPAYRLDLAEIATRALQAQDRGATEVCLQGGIHPDYTGETYLDIVRAVKAAVPDIHVHAFSPLEITHGAQTLGLSLVDYLDRLRQAGLSTLPGTAAEILDDEVRAVICPDKLNTSEWLDVMRAAHAVGLRSTATIMFGHVERPEHWARHLIRVRDLQSETGGFTEFVPLPFVHMEAPMWRKQPVRPGPTFREAVLMHAVSRLALHPLIANIQTSWVKMGAEGAAVCLQAGANDLGGILMDESITRAAGGVNGQEFDVARMQSLAASIDRPTRQRTTLYGVPWPSNQPAPSQAIRPPVMVGGANAER